MSGPDREVAWAGVANARDLGGLPLGAGSDDPGADPAAAVPALAAGRLFRSAKPDNLTAEGWAAASAAGVRTVVDLRSSWERRAAAPAGIRIVHAPVEDVDDTDFLAWWRENEGAPRTWSAVLERWPRGVAGAVAAVAEGLGSGAVLVHCSAGRDRTGMIVALLLREAGVPAEAIVEDYVTAYRGIRAHYLTLADPPETLPSDEEFERKAARNAADLAAFLAAVDPARMLADGGVAPDTLRRAAAVLTA